MSDEKAIKLRRVECDRVSHGRADTAYDVLLNGDCIGTVYGRRTESNRLIHGGRIRGSAYGYPVRWSYTPLGWQFRSDSGFYDRRSAVTSLVRAHLSHTESDLS